MRDTIKGAILGAFVAAAVSVLLAQTTPSWTSPRTWATDDLLTASQFNAQIRDNFLNMRGFAACAENGTTGTSSAGTVLYGDCRWDAAAAVTIAALGCTGTPSAATFLRGDCEWAEPPQQYSANFMTSRLSTNSLTFVDAGDPATLSVPSGASASIRVFGSMQSGSSNCHLRLRNVTTGTDFEVYGVTASGAVAPDFVLGVEVDDSSPAVGVNVYQIQFRSTGFSSCGWDGPQENYSGFSDAYGFRGLIAFVS